LPNFSADPFLEGINRITTSVLPFASLDTLGLGAMLAFLWQGREGEAGEKALKFCAA